MSRPVLVVEDHRDSRQLMEDFLGAAGIPTIAASDGLEAFKRLGESTPCLILLDLWMPEMDGWRFREEQRRLNDSALAEVPVVILTAGLDCEEEPRAVGAVAFLRKPVNLDRLMEVDRKYAGAAV